MTDRILKTYARVVVDDLDASLAAFERLVGAPADLRFAIGDVDFAAVGAFLLIGGDVAALGDTLDAVGPVIVADLDESLRSLVDQGAEIIVPPAESATGRFAYVRHTGVAIELVRWHPELVERIITARG